MNGVCISSHTFIRLPTIMAALDSFCPVCFGDLVIATTYTMTCGSVDTHGVAIPHNICNDCEHVLRMRAPLSVDARGKLNRVIICPLCKVVEVDRTVGSLMREIQATNEVVVEFVRHLPGVAPAAPRVRAPRVRVPRAPAALVAPVAPAPRGAKQWCHIKTLRGERVCNTKGKTARKCAGDGCEIFICRSCRVC